MSKSCDLTHLHAVHSDDDEAIARRLTMAATYCRNNGVRFTALRQQVYEIVLKADRPLGAYDVLGQLQQERNQTCNDHATNIGDNPSRSTKSIAPPTVYRALEFLLAQGFIHQLTSINAFVPCCHPRDEHVAAFLICERCGQVQECSSLPVQQVLEFAKQTMGFAAKQSVMELSGLCQNCQTNTADAAN